MRKLILPLVLSLFTLNFSYAQADIDGDGYDDTVDCNDSDPSINPGMTEDQCDNDGIDNNCNGSIDENYNYNACNGIFDNDGDGYDTSVDCDDNNPSINPGMTEGVCDNDGIDNNCSGSADENYDYVVCNGGGGGPYDMDGDGYYDDVDCNDNDWSINPGVYEDQCNNDGIDNNCNGSTDENYDYNACNGGGGPYDNDGDGYDTSVDCDDNNPSINPGQSEGVCDNDGIDNNCNGSTDEGYDYISCNGGGGPYDMDGDGYYSDVDCNDNDGSINPGYYEDQCNNDGIDNNCDGNIDENYDYIACNGGGGPYDNDGDGYYDTDDCNDFDSSINPGQYEDYCNNDGIDNNCNGLVDENYDNYLCNGGAYDNDGDGYNEIDDCNDWDSSVNPGVYEDQCNNDGIDNNCNGSIDENYDYNACYGIYDNDGDGYDSNSDCDDTNFDINPGSAEICDGIDNNCNGSADEGLPLTVYYIDNDGDGYGAGSAGDFCADPGVGYSSTNDDCDDDDSSIYPGAPEIILNGIDEDCNGVDQLVGIEENESTVVSLYPNPGNESVTIKVGASTNETWQIEFFDAQGKSVLSESFQTAENGMIKLNTSKLERGVYQIVIRNAREIIHEPWGKF